MGILLGWTNLAEGSAANLSVDSEAPGLGLRAVLTPQISDVWRSAAWGATTISLAVDLGAAQPVNLVAIAAPRDGLLPSAATKISLGASAFAAPSYANQQVNPKTIVPGGGTYVIGANASDLGAVTAPDGTSGARRLGSTSATGESVSLSRAAVFAAAPSTPYDLTITARSNAVPPTSGLLLTVDEYNAGGVVTRSNGSDLASSTIDSEWRTFTRRFTTRSDTISFQVYWAEGWQTGAELDVYDASIVRRPEAIDTGDQPFSLSPFGVWGWCSQTSVSARYLRLAFTGGAADAYLQLGRLWIGSALITKRQASYGFSNGATDPGSSVRAGISGVRDIQRGRPYRTLAFAGDTLTNAEAAQIEQAALIVGSTGQVFIARQHSDLANTGAFGVFSRAPTLTRINHLLWRGDFAVEEDL